MRGEWSLLVEKRRGMREGLGRASKSYFVIFLRGENFEVVEIMTQCQMLEFFFFCRSLIGEK